MNTMLKKYNDVLLISLALLFLLKLIIVRWSLDKGIDLTDEGWFLLNYNFPAEDKAPISQVHHILNLWFPFLEFNIKNVRILRLFFEVLGALILSAGTLYFLKKKGSLLSRKTILFVVFFTLTGFYTSAFSRNVGYYELTAFLLSVSLGIYFLQYHQRQWYWVMFLGFIQPWVFFCKFSSGVISLLFFLILLIVEKTQIKGVVLYFIGASLSVLIYFFAQGLSLEIWLTNFESGLESASLLGYSINELIVRVYLKEMFVLFAVALFARKLHHTVLQEKWGNSISYFIITITSMVIFLVVFTERITFLGRHEITQGVYLFSFLPIILGFVGCKDVKKDPILLSLPFLPFIAIIGSDTVISINLWSFLYPILLYIAISFIAYKKMEITTLSATVVVTTFFFVFNTVINPYRLHKSIFDQNVSIRSHYGEKILVDDSLAQFYHNVVKELEGVEKPFPIIARYDLPSIVYLIGGYSPETPWYFSGESSKKFNEYHLNRVKNATELYPTSQKTTLYWNNQYYLLKK